MSCRNAVMLPVGLVVMAGCQAEETRLQTSGVAYEAIEESFTFPSMNSRISPSRAISVENKRFGWKRKGMEKVLVSACLLGKRVRYDGGAKTLSSEILAQWQAEGRVVSVCPEVEAGLPTPRSPAEIIAGDGGNVLAGSARVVDLHGEDLTKAFLKGASLALQLCRQHDIKVAVLTELSPSCGSTQIYDGSFSGAKRAGVGITAALLRQYDVRVFDQHEIAEAQRVLQTL